MKCKVTTFDALKRRVMALTLGFWLLLMVLLTWAVAQDMYNQLDAQLKYASMAVGHSQRDTLPGAREKAMFENLSYPYFLLRFHQLLPIVHPHTPNGVGSNDWLYGKWELFYGYEATVVYLDEEGQPALPTGDILFFEYVTQKQWDNSQEEETVGYGYVDLSALEGGSEIADNWFRSSPSSSYMWLWIDLVRMRGYFDGTEFIPVGIAWGRYDNPWSTQTIHRDNEFGFSNQDRRGNIEWTNVYSDPTPTEQKLVTIYCFELRGCNRKEKAVTVEGKTFSSLGELGKDPESYRYEKESLLESVLVTHRVCPELEGISSMVTVVRFWPLGYAVARLWRVYVISLALAAVLIWLLMKNLKRELTQPLEQLSMKLSGLSVMRPDWVEYDSRWQEPYDLERKTVDLQQQLQESQAEIRQLQTALEYAKDAESYRRRMISGLTHELKTPLAVIHSYAEGLQEGIAQEKKEQYLGVILEESEKMDAMVLQMLDLSRLEAGKVKLAADSFSLAALTRAVFDKMQPLAEAKGLTVRFTVPNECRLTADEGRITQVVTNLASNAIKYTPEGGEISVIVYRKNDTNILCVENTCERLSDEALSKVFDSFYRGDAARTTEGTGLGLAIVKAIVEQHGGSCRAFNTPTGVQFQVILP